MMHEQRNDLGGFLDGVRVLELADELGEYTGKVLAGLGADVVKVEPPAGEITRTYGPFYHDAPHPDRSLYFWHYNLGKRGITLDLDAPADQDRFRKLAADADVIIDTRPRGYLAERGLDGDTLRQTNPGLIHARITPFGDSGPWADHQAGDLVHLALGGLIMNCGYDPDPDGRYDTPPVAPQMWQAYHLAGEMATIGILGALNHRLETGRGQDVATSVHQAVSANTESDVPDWVYQRLPHGRQTCRHSLPAPSPQSIALTKDGRWILPYRTYLPPSFGDPIDGTIKLLADFGMQGDLEDPQYQDPEVRRLPQTHQHIGGYVDAFVRRTLYARDIWRDAQHHGLAWGPVRKPEENLDDEHWAQRETFIEVDHPELGERFTYVGARWHAPEVPWPVGPRAPLLGEHTAEIVDQPPPPKIRPQHPVGDDARRETSQLGTPFALSGVRVVDLSWLLASGGAGRYLTAMGAEVIKVEHSSRMDAMRFSAGYAPTGGRAERDAATGPITDPDTSTPNRCGMFGEITAGKRSLSLNLKSDRGREILTALLRDADMVIEGFSPGTMDRLGFGYEALKQINPRIVYVQQSGLGQTGTYGRLRSYGPTAQAISGLSDMSGLPEPYPPAGIGYSYLDWFGAYNMAMAMLAALHRQRARGLGCWIDSSQTEAGIYLTGTAVLDHSVNGRQWSRYGNRSPYKRAAPHGVYPVAGEDRWIAVSCFTDEQWRALAATLGHPEWAAEERLSTLDGRLAAVDELDAWVAAATADRDPFTLMAELQAAGVPAGVCQTAQDRCEDDPQLAHLGWTVELEQTEIGSWPVRGIPAQLSETPLYIGGTLNRSGPNYGEDNAYVLGELLGLSDAEQARLVADGVT